MFAAGPVDLTVYGFDSVMNRSKPVRWSGTAPLAVRLMADDRAGARAGQAVQLVAWAEGGAVKGGTRRLFEASRDNGKTWTTVRRPAASAGCTWKPARFGKHKIRVTATNGREKAVQTVTVVVKG